jgi:hypothetical protein
MFSNADGRHYDYTDHFEAPITAARDRTPEQWARAVFEDAPGPLRGLFASSFRYGLGLRLGPRTSPEHVLGWEIVDRQPDSITLESRSWFLTSRLVFRAEGSCLTQSTLVHYDRRIATVLWPPVSILHRQIVPRLLARAGSRG